MVSMNVSNCGRSEFILRLKRSDYALEYLHMLYGNAYLEYAITKYYKQYTSFIHLGFQVRSLTIAFSFDYRPSRQLGSCEVNSVF
jgi:hypothetical protein